jgi:hypothetical protein
MTVDVNLMMLFQVVLPKGQPPGWNEGPLPVPVLLSDDGSSRADARVVAADAEWRSKHLLPRVAEALTGHHRATARLHRTVSGGKDVSIGNGARVQLDALELLLVRKRSPGLASDPRRRVGVLALHLRVVEPGWVTEADGSATPVRPTTRTILGGIKHLCRDLVDASQEELRWELPAVLTSTVGPGVEAADGYENAYVAVLLTPRAPEKSKPPPIPDSPELWNLAMVSPSQNPGPPVERDAGLALRLPKSQVLVTRLGLVQRGRGQGEPAVPTTTNGQHCYRFRTIYLDGLLMAMMQRRLLDELSDSSSRLVDPVRSPVGFNRLSREFRQFRVTWWWRSFSRWTPADRVVEAVQEELGLVQHYEELKQDHGFFAEMLQAAKSSRTNALILALAVLSVAGVAADLIVAFEISDLTVRTALVTSVPVLALVIWLTLSVVRRLVDWLRRI